MEYEFTLTVDAGKTRANPATKDCKLTHGIIHHYAVQFQEGCNSLVYVAIDQGGHQAFPINREEAFHGNAMAIEKTTFYELESAPYALRLRAWAPDCTYPHELVVRFDVLPREHLEPQKVLTRAVSAMMRLLGVRE